MNEEPEPVEGWRKGSSQSVWVEYKLLQLLSTQFVMRLYTANVHILKSTNHSFRNLPKGDNYISTKRHEEDAYDSKKNGTLHQQGDWLRIL
jgi:hypothetical protein